MKQASKVQAIIEILTEVLENAKPSDKIIDKYLKDRRYIGSKDRRFIIDNVWNIIRNRLKYSFMLKNDVTARLLSAYHFMSLDEDLTLLFNGEQYAPDLLNHHERHLLANLSTDELSQEAIYECPTWLLDKFSDKRLLASLNDVAPLDVRANLTSREAAKYSLQKEGLFFANTPFSPIGLRSTDRVNLNNCMTYQDGKIDVMDEASSLIAMLCDVKDYHKTIDYCAGAGGKSLAICSLLNNQGKVYAYDINKSRLDKIEKRQKRLEIKNITILDKVIDEDYTRFIIDAPCSGSGVWRRNPDAKYRFNQDDLTQICKTQAQLLEIGARHTKSGGKLIYITCSVLKEENENQIIQFLHNYKEFKTINHKELWQEITDLRIYPFLTEEYLHFSPLNTKTDGFFFCCLEKN